MQDCIDYAATSQDEVCGLILDGERLFRCRNTHPRPQKQFRISDEDWLAAEKEGEITAVFHSHPQGGPILSANDRRAQLTTGLEWWLVSDGRLMKFRPVPHLLGRRFEHGVSDCYSIFRDAYHLCGIELPDFERSDSWWLRGENLYLQNLAGNGFTRVTAEGIQPGDIILRIPFPGCAPCHAMIYLGNNIILHHDVQGHISRREPYRLAYMRQTHSIWRHHQCSSLDLRGISEDISAKSL